MRVVPIAASVIVLAALLGEATVSCVASAAVQQHVASVAPISAAAVSVTGGNNGNG
ncbi:MAG TPA: hypothetical protein VGS97_03920 [Actinocrinis sp.]|uniref:hypothetical protein n=1 Tax=Actinocrinis sp. TaxID=1920516 RepID=UPI002DDD5DFA|nr:hypothetical protein [Actinocrinis sp.]HEV2343216.1 hypothetical protein [Actinocrinis sp.]